MVSFEMQVNFSLFRLSGGTAAYEYFTNGVQSGTLVTPPLSDLAGSGANTHFGIEIPQIPVSFVLFFKSTLICNRLIL